MNIKSNSGAGALALIAYAICELWNQDYLRIHCIRLLCIECNVFMPQHRKHFCIAFNRIIDGLLLLVRNLKLIHSEIRAGVKPE